MQIGAVHRVHHVFQCVLVIAFPRGGAEKIAVGVGVSQFVREAQFIGLLIGGNAKPKEDGPVHFLHVVAAHTLLADQRTFIHRRHILHFAVTRHFHAVIPAGDTIAQIPAHRQTRATVRTAIFQRLHLAILVAPDHNLFTQTGDPHGRRLNFPTGQHRVPEAAQTFIKIVLYGSRHRIALSSR